MQQSTGINVVFCWYYKVLALTRSPKLEEESSGGLKYLLLLAFNQVLLFDAQTFIFLSPAFLS